MSPLVIAGKEFRSRLILGTGKYASLDLMKEALDASGTEMVTVAVRRVNLQDRSDRSFFSYIDRNRYWILPNTAGCYTAEDAIR
ncbi:MAG TPA: thiazole synthase, partial [Acidobacteriota bacterium]